MCLRLIHWKIQFGVVPGWGICTLILSPTVGFLRDPGTFDWGVQTLVQKGLLNFFVANYFSQRRPPVSQSVNAGRRLRGKYCFASRGKHRQNAKCNVRFIKKKKQPVKK